MIRTSGIEYYVEGVSVRIITYALHKIFNLSIA